MKNHLPWPLAMRWSLKQSSSFAMHYWSEIPPGQDNNLLIDLMLLINPLDMDHDHKHVLNNQNFKDVLADEYCSVSSFYLHVYVQDTTRGMLLTLKAWHLVVMKDMSIGDIYKK